MSVDNTLSFDSHIFGKSGLSEILKLGARRLLIQAVEQEVEDYITAAAGEKISPEQRRTMPAMHQITAKNLLIPITRLSRKKDERNEVYRREMEKVEKESGLKVATEAAVKNLISSLTDYSNIKVLTQNAKMEKSKRG